MPLLRSLTGVFVERDGFKPQMFSAGSLFECSDKEAAGFLKEKLAEKVDDQEPRAMSDATANNEQPEAGQAPPVDNRAAVKSPAQPKSS